MKKTTAALLLTGWIAAGARAQSFGLGAKGGMNISSYAGGNMQSKALVGYHLGGMLSFGFGRVLSLQPEVLFSKQGARVTTNGKSERLSTQYITLPVMLKLKASGGFYLEIGPQFAYRSSERIPEQNFSSFTRNLDLSAALGMGFSRGQASVSAHATWPAYPEWAISPAAISAPTLRIA